MAAKLLIADDDATIIHLLRVNLEMEGYDVVVASDGAEAVQMAQDTNPDLIILDVMMPNMDGLAAQQVISKLPSFADTPIIMLSAKAQEADIQAGYEAGVAEYLTKPFDPGELLEVIEQILAGTYERRG